MSNIDQTQIEKRTSIKHQNKDHKEIKNKNKTSKSNIEIKQYLPKHRN